MKMKCMIVDDEPIARKLLREYISDIPFLLLVGETDNALKAQGVLANDSIDIIFLDINMPKLTGIEFLKSNQSLPLVIMTTAYAEYALDSYGLDVLDYLVKPFSFERFLKACNKVKDYHQLKQTASGNSRMAEDYFFVKFNGRIEKVFYDQLLFVEASLNYVTLHTVNRKMIVYLTFKGIMESLPANQFIKVHKSFIVNAQKVESISGSVLRIGKQEIPVGQKSHDDVMSMILKDKVLKR